MNSSPITDGMDKEYEMALQVMGHCDSCKRVTARNVTAWLDESDLAPCECAHCKSGTVHFERLIVRHSFSSKKVKKTLSWIFWGILISAILLLVCAEIRIHRDYNVDEVSVAMASTSSKSTPEILAAFSEAGIRETLLSEILRASPFTLRRISEGKSTATASMDAAIRGLYTDFGLLNNSRVLFFLKYSTQSVDQWYAYQNPLQESSPEPVNED